MPPSSNFTFLMYKMAFTPSVVVPLLSNLILWFTNVLPSVIVNVWLNFCHVVVGEKPLAVIYPVFW